MLWLAVAFGFYLLLLFGIARLSLYPFRIPLFTSPGAMGSPQEEVTIESEGNLLRCWWVDVPNARAVMILSHGYMMNRAELAPVAHLLAQRGVACLLVDLRAHGKSGGRKSGLGLREAQDVLAAVQWVRTKVPGAKIGLLGSSMGAAASAFAAAEAAGTVDVLVLDSAYGRLSSAVLGWWRFVGGRWLAAVLSPTVLVAAPMAGFNPFKVDVAQALARMGAVPTLLLHGGADDLALPIEAERNLAACTGPKEIVWFPGYGHSEGRWEMPEQYNAALFGFLERHGFVSA